MHDHSRRGFLHATLGACWAGASLLEQSVLRAAQARAQAPSAPANLFRIERMAPGVYAAIALPATFINCNAVIFEQFDGLLVVDTHSKPSAAAALAAQIRKDVGPKPVRYIVETHFHWDHTQGTAAYRRLSPRPQIFSSTETRRLIADLGAARLRESVEQLPKSLEEYKQKLASASGAGEKARLTRLIRDTRAYMEEMRHYTPELPDVTFQDDLVIHDKAHDLHLAFRGRGHTSGDICVFCPQKKAIATGDLAHGFFPFIGDGYPREWPETLAAVSHFNFDALAGGHGGVLRSREPVDGMAGYISSLTGLVERAKAGRRTLDEVQQAVAPAFLKSFEDSAYGRFLSASQPLEEGVRGNIADIYKALERP